MSRAPKKNQPKESFMFSDLIKSGIEKQRKPQKKRMVSLGKKKNKNSIIRAKERQPIKIPKRKIVNVRRFSFSLKWVIAFAINSYFLVRTKMVPPLIPGIKLTTPTRKPVKKIINFTNLIYVLLFK